MSEEKCNVKKCSFYGSGSPDECGTQCITCSSWYKNPSEIMHRKIIDLEQQLQTAKEKLSVYENHDINGRNITNGQWIELCTKYDTLTQQNKQMQEALEKIEVEINKRLIKGDIATKDVNIYSFVMRGLQKGIYAPKGAE